jgi:orotidine-5'-phosphate decarboxylase
MNLCVALDMGTKGENLALSRELEGLDIWYKVGLRSFIRDGWSFVEELKKGSNAKIFLDLKLYDIPNTMADAAQEIVEGGLIDMFNVHASAGRAALQVVMDRIGAHANRPLVLAVTALTSFDRQAFYEIYNASLDQKAAEFAEWSKEAGLDGVVCSAHESRLIKYATSADFLTLCPGVRPDGHEAGDQKRVANISYAMDEMVDFAVVGRPIYTSLSPRMVAEEILNSIANYA